MMMRMLMTVLAVAALAGCGGKGTTAAPAKADAPLYDRLGGRDAIAAVVKDFVEERVAKDARINAQFANADIPALETKLTDQICEATGGPCKYTGKDMKAAHVGMKITDADFNALVDDLKASLEHFKVGAKEQKQLLDALAAMHDDVVTM